MTPVAAPPVAPAPTVIINNTSAPQPTTQKMEAAPAVEKKAEEAPAVEQKTEQAPAKTVSPEQLIAPTSVAPSLQLQKPTMTDVSSAMPGYLPPEAVGIPKPYPVAPMTLPATGAGIPKPYVAPVVEPAAGPAAPVSAPALPVAPEATKPAKPLTAQSLTDALKRVRKDNPNATVADAVASIIGPDASFAPLEFKEAANIPAVDLLKGGKLGDAYVAGVAQELNSAVLKGKAEVEQANIQLEAAKQEEVRQAERAVADKQRADDLRNHANTLMAEAKASDDLKSFFGSQSAGYNIMSIVALALGGFTSGYTKTENYVLKAFDNASDKNLEEQKRRRDSKWSRYKEALGSADAADLLVKADNDLLASVALNKATIRQNVTKVQPQIESLQAQLLQKAAMNMAALDLKLAQAEDKREVAPPKVVVGRGGGAAVKKTGAEIKHEEWETGRVFGIGGIPVKASGATGMKDVRENLANRNQAISALDEAVHILESLKPGESINVLSPDRQKALSSVALQIENFPLAFGFKRAVSKVAKDQLKEAVSNPLGIVAFLKEQFGDVSPATGMRQLRDDTVNARKNFVKGQAQADRRREQDAAEYGLWKQRAEELARFKAPIPPRPELSTAYGELERLPDEPATAPSATTPGAPKTFTITSTETGATRKTTDAATADRFRNQTGFTVVP